KGSSLSKPVREFFEPRLGVDLGNVKVHTGPKANTLARSVNARAFTYQNQIVFGKGQYQPGTTEGNKLIGHELVHTVQQSGGVQRQMDGVVQRDVSTRIEYDNDTLLTDTTSISLYYHPGRDWLYSDVELRAMGDYDYSYYTPVISNVNCIGFYKHKNIATDQYNLSCPLPEYTYCYILKPTATQWDIIKEQMHDPVIGRRLYSYCIHPFLEAAVAALPETREYRPGSSVIQRHYQMFGVIDEADIRLFMNKFLGVGGYVSSKQDTNPEFDFPDVLMSNAQDDVLALFLGKYMHLAISNENLEQEDLYDFVHDVMDTPLFGGGYLNKDELATSMMQNIFAFAVTTATKTILEGDVDEIGKMEITINNCGEAIGSISRICKKIDEKNIETAGNIFDFVWGLMPFSNVIDKIGVELFKAIAEATLDAFKDKVKGVFLNCIPLLGEGKEIEPLRRAFRNMFLGENKLVQFNESRDRYTAASNAVDKFITGTNANAKD
ncbi:MAG: DUF4157 domain-containing protein, partial [Candidatus Delongbacteria bacterium]|nr:DUF4157 domain-containing protein [Candidatus Delongbacteria bacterium]